MTDVAASRPAAMAGAAAPDDGRPRIRLAPLLVVAALLTGCGDGSTDEVDDGAPVTAPPPGSPSPPGEAGDAATAAGDDCPAPTGDLAAFPSREITVVAADGAESERCVLVADRPELRRRGLMEIEDLGPFAGMLFAHGQDLVGGYWMRDTPMPLTIAWVDASGEVVRTADMEPCLEPDTSCRRYMPGSQYRWAVEVPQGTLDDFGLVDGARLDVAALPEGEA